MKSNGHYICWIYFFMSFFGKSWVTKNAEQIFLIGSLVDTFVVITHSRSQGWILFEWDIWKISIPII